MGASLHMNQKDVSPLYTFYFLEAPKGRLRRWIHVGPALTWQMTYWKITKGGFFNIIF